MNLSLSLIPTDCFGSGPHENVSTWCRSSPPLSLLPVPPSSGYEPHGHQADFEALLSSCHIPYLKPLASFPEFPVSFIIWLLSIFLALASLLLLLTLLPLPSSGQPISLWAFDQEKPSWFTFDALLCDPPHGVVSPAIPQPLPVLTAMAGFHGWLQLPKDLFWTELSHGLWISRAESLICGRHTITADG